MTKFISTWRQLVLVLGIIFAACTAFASSHAFALGSTPVTVVNPSVTVGGTVNVGNPSDIAKAQNAIRHPLLGSAGCSFNANTCTSAFVANNSGQLQSIDYVSGDCIIKPGAPATEQLITVQVTVNTAANTTSFFDLPIVDHVGVVIPNFQQVITVGQTTHFLLGPGDSISFNTSVFGSPGNSSLCTFAFSGEQLDFQ